MEITGWVALIGGIVVSRVLNERAFRQLTPEEKIRLMDGFSATRAYALIPILVLVGLFWFASTKTSLDRTLLFTSYFGLLILYVMVRAILNHRKMLQLEMPLSYRRMFSLSQAITFLTVAWFFFTLFTALRT